MAEGDFEALVKKTEGFQPMRRVVHVVSGLVLAGALWVLQPPTLVAVSVLAAVVLILFVSDLIRLARPGLNALFFRAFRPLVSPREAVGIASATWFMAGILVTVSLFPLEVAVPAIVVLALADPAANYAGRTWGRRRLGTGTVEGTAVFVAVAFLTLSPVAPLPSAFLAALLAAVAEVLPWKLDDNLVIPVTVSAVLWFSGVI